MQMSETRNWLGYVLAVGVLAALPTVSQATPWMSDAELSAEFGGHTIDGVYSDGQTFRESYHDGGRLTYRENREVRTGYWSVVRGTFCTIYDLQDSGGCFRVRRRSQNCFEFYFITRNEAEARQRDPDREPISWTARAWDIRRPSTCDETPVVNGTYPTKTAAFSEFYLRFT